MNRIRCGLIGYGDVARKRVAHAILDEPRSELVAACRRDEAGLKKFCDTFGIDRAYTSADQLLADADIDAVYIATPTCEHKPQTLAAARTGKHVLVVAAILDDRDPAVMGEEGRETNAVMERAYAAAR